MTQPAARSLVHALAYIGLASPDIDAWAQFAGGTLGMQVERRGDDELRLRMDDKAQRYLVQRADAGRLAFLGFEVVDAEALAALKDHLRSNGVAVHEGDAAACADRCVDALMWVNDPDDNRVEFVLHLHDATNAFTPSKPIGGFCTGELGIGHAVLYTPHYAAMSAFYQGLLAFRLSDYHHEPFPIEFLRVNPRHHSLGLLSDAGPPRIHHLMVEYQYWDDVGRAYDIALTDPERIAVSLGRHLNDHVTSFYMWTPDKYFVEIGWAGRMVDDATWEPTDLAAPSLWGHVRYWQTPEKREQTRKMIAAVAARGERAPTTVRGEGFFSLPSVAAAAAAEVNKKKD